MDIRRGDVVLVAGPGGAAGGVRPFVIVQSDLFAEAHPSVSLCPLSRTVGGQHLFRIALPASGETGLEREGEVQVDKVQSLRRDRLSRVIGSVPATIMTRVDDALRRWLTL